MLEYIADDQTPFEAEPLERLANEGQLMAYKHETSGSVWIIFVTCGSSKASGRAATLHGRCGNTEDKRTMVSALIVSRHCLLEAQ